MTVPPRILRERYELGALLGRGGMADVFRAHDHVLHRDVAVKLLRDATDLDRERFASEVRLMGMLNHPHVVTALDTGVEDDETWLVLELVEGAALDVLMGETPIEPTRVAAIGAQVAAALAHAHAHDIVHRDVKPSNVLVAAGDRAKLTDFGIARRTVSASLTMTGHTIGTAAYLAPEQVAGEQVATSADVYALGLVLLEALTGRREYDGPVVEAALARLQRSPTVPASLPTGWPGLISTMTARVPAERPSASDVAARLTVIAGSAPRIPPLTAATEQWSSSGVPAPRRRLALVVGAAGLAGLLLATTLLVTGGADDEPASASDSPTSTISPAPSTAATPTSSPTPEVAAGTGVTGIQSATPSASSPPPRPPTSAQKGSGKKKQQKARAQGKKKKKKKKNPPGAKKPKRGKGR